MGIREGDDEEGRLVRDGDERVINEICPECDCCFEPVFGRRGACPGCGLTYHWDLSDSPPSVMWSDDDDCDCDDDDDEDDTDEAY